MILLLSFWVAGWLFYGSLFPACGFVHLDLYIQSFTLAAAVKSTYGTGVQIVESDRHAHVATVCPRVVGHVEPLPTQAFNPGLGPGVASQNGPWAEIRRQPVLGRQVPTYVAGGNVQFPATGYEYVRVILADTCAF